MQLSRIYLISNQVGKVADTIVSIVDARLTRAGADTLVIVVDALMTQVLAGSTAWEVGAHQARAGADLVAPCLGGGRSDDSCGDFLDGSDSGCCEDFSGG